MAPCLDNTGAGRASETPLLVFTDADGIVRSVHRGRALAQAAPAMFAPLENGSARNPSSIPL